MIGLIFTGIIFFIVGIALIFGDDCSMKNYFAIVLLTIGFACFHEYWLKTRPQARDSIPMDSVVVFKE